MNDLIEANSAWWESQGALRRFVSDLLYDQFSRLRPGRPRLPAPPWPARFALDGDGLGADSLELFSLATTLAEAIHLHESRTEDRLLTHGTIDDWVEIAAGGLECFHARLTFRTAGSVGRSESCPHSLLLLAEEIATHLAMLGPFTRVVSAVPSHHIYGFLFTLLLPRCAGKIPVVDIRSSSPAHLARTLRAGDLVVGHPEFWRAVARSVPLLPSGVVGVTSTAPCPLETAETVAEIGLTRLLEIYGSSETAGIAWRDKMNEPYEVFSYWRRRGVDGITRNAGEHAPDLHYNLPDHVEWLDDRHFWLRGRRDAAVQIGGVNVFPERVRHLLCQHPDVEQAAVRLMRPHEGIRLKAFIVPKEGADLEKLRTSLALWIAAKLPSTEQPRALTFGTALPAGTMGKAADWLLS